MIAVLQCQAISKFPHKGAFIAYLWNEKRKVGEIKYMQFSKLNRDSQENVYRTVKNVEGATITTGLPVSLANTSNDGINAVISNATADYPGFIGIAVADIANNDYGRIQIGGFVNSVLLTAAGASVTINALDPLVQSGGGLTSAAPTYANSGFKFLIASNVPVAVSAASYASGLIRVL
jgi:hypothetical protein